jgi:glycerol-3-phosphate dehydrogenase (NAD(P)+)
MVLADKELDVKLYSHDEFTVNSIKKIQENINYLPGIQFPDNLEVTNDKKVFNESQYIVNTVPTQFIKEFYKNQDINLKDKFVINGSKGIVISDLTTISSIFEKDYSVESENYCVLTGPSHAEEVARKMPTAVVSVSKNKDLALKVQEIFNYEYFRVYNSSDVIGAELGGALKNVIAISIGILVGMGFGDNARAAILTRGLAEISRLGITLGADPLTFSGLSGLGDLFVTCDSKHSRNRSFGEKIGKGEKVENILSSSKQIAEGVYTAKAIYELSKKMSIEMPICNEVYYIIYEGKELKMAVKDLITRQSKAEIY